MKTSGSEVVIVHQWLTADRGAEVVLREFLRMFPQAPIVCLVKRREFNPTWLAGRTIIESPLSRIPFSRKIYRQLLPLHPWAIRRTAVPRGCKIVLSSDAAMIKGVTIPIEARHTCYCHSPPRYLWDQMDNYLLRQGAFASIQNAAFRSSVNYCRRFDRRSGEKVNGFIANSEFVAQRIAGVYGKEAAVIYPPVHIDEFDKKDSNENYYIIVSHLVPYKRVDIAVEACSRTKRNLVVVGGGPDLRRLKARAGGTVRFTGRLPRAEVCRLIMESKAFLYPQVEDFGITAIEAQAAGKPVIALAVGGALETVVDGVTGVYFNSQSVSGMIDGLEKFESLDRERSRGARNGWADACRENALRFNAERFRREIAEYLAEQRTEVPV